MYVSAGIAFCRTRLAPVLVTSLVVLGVTRGLFAGWVPATGIKNGSDAATELSDPWNGTQLIVQGGTLQFDGSASVTGPVLLQQQNGWGNPTVSVAGGFNMNGPSFSVVDGAKFQVLGVSPGSVSTGFLTINGGSQVAIGSLSANQNVLISGAGSSLHVVGDYQQIGGDFRVDQGANFQADGAFNAEIGDLVVSDGATFSVGDPGAGSVSTGFLTINGGSQVAIGSLSANQNVLISGAGSSLHVVGDYQQIGGDFRVDQGANFQADGAFNAEIGDLVVSDGATFSVGDPGAGSVSTGFLTINGGSQVAIGSLSANQNVLISGAGSSLHVVGDYQQIGGDFRVDQGANFQADGAFNAEIGDLVVSDGATFSVGDPGAGSVSTGFLTINGGSQVAIGSLSANQNVLISGAGSSLHVVGDYQQIGGDFRVDQGANFQADGAFNAEIGDLVVSDGATFSVGDPGAGSVSTGFLTINGGSQVAIGSLSANQNVLISGAGSSLHVVGDYQQIGGDFRVDQGANFQADGAFNAEIGDLVVSDGATFSVGDPGAGSVSTGFLTINGGSQVAIGSLSANQNVLISGAGSSLHVVGDYQQIGGDFRVDQGANFQADGAFNAEIGDLVVSDGATFSVGDPGAGSVSTGFLTINGGSQVAIGSLSANQNVLISGAGSSLHVVGDYQQIGGDFKVDQGANFQADGTFEYSTPGPVNLLVDTTSTLQVGTRLQLNDENILQIDGEANVGSGAMPSAGTLRVGSGGTLAGSGTILGNVVVEDGIVSPGFSPGVLHVNGDFLQGPNGYLAIEIAGLTLGSQYDQLDVTGNLVLHGAIDVSLLNGFLPQVGDQFELLKFGGGFDATDATFHFLNAPSGLEFSRLAIDGAFTLTVTAVPEPSTLALAVVGGFVLGFISLRKRKALNNPRKSCAAFSPRRDV